MGRKKPNIYRLADPRSFFSLVLVSLAPVGMRASDLVGYRVTSPLTVDGYSADWTTVEDHHLPGDWATIRFAHDQSSLYILLRISSVETAYLISRKGMSLWIDSKGQRDPHLKVRYSGSRELLAEIELNHNPFQDASINKGELSNKRPPGPGLGAGPLPSLPPGLGDPHASVGFETQATVSRNDPQEICKRVMDPGILLVTQEGRTALQLECGSEDLCAASRYDPPNFCFEFRLPLAGLCLEWPDREQREVRRVSIGLEVPELRQDREEVVTMTPAQGSAGGGMPGGGMGGGMPGGGMGGGMPGGGMGGGMPGGGMDAAGAPGGPRAPKGFKGGATYSVSKTVRWMDVLLSTQAKRTPPPLPKGDKASSEGDPAGAG